METERKLDRKEGGQSLRQFQAAPELRTILGGNGDGPSSSEPEYLSQTSDLAAPEESRHSAPLEGAAGAPPPSLTPFSAQPPKETKTKSSRSISHEEGLALYQEELAAKKEREPTPLANPEAAITASKAGFVHNSALSILNKDSWKKKRGEKHKISDALHCLGELEPGEKALVLTTIRISPHLQNISQSAINQIRMEGRVTVHKPKTGSSVLIKKIKKMMTFLQKNFTQREVKNPKPIARMDLSEDVKEALTIAENKVRDMPHFETAFRVLISRSEEHTSE